MKDFYRNRSLKMQDQVFRVQVNVLFSFEGTFDSGRQSLVPLYLVSNTPVRRLELDSSGSLDLLFLIILVRVQDSQGFRR